jgi:hypothetical protein
VHRFAGCCVIWLELDQRLTTGSLKHLLNATRCPGFQGVGVIITGFGDFHQISAEKIGVFAPK